MRKSLHQHHLSGESPSGPKSISGHHELIFGVPTDDEAAQYYDKLTTLFQETRQKLQEFNDDFQQHGRGGSANKKQPLRSSDISPDGQQQKARSSIHARESLLGELNRAAQASSHSTNSHSVNRKFQVKSSSSRASVNRLKSRRK